jgi:hypothetical protein
MRSREIIPPGIKWVLNSHESYLLKPSEGFESRYKGFFINLVFDDTSLDIRPSHNFCN